MNNFFIHIYFSWDIYFMASRTTLFCFYFKTAEKMSWKAKNWITQNLTCEYNSGRLNIYLPKTVGLTSNFKIEFCERKYLFYNLILTFDISQFCLSNFNILLFWVSSWLIDSFRSFITNFRTSFWNYLQNMI